MLVHHAPSSLLLLSAACAAGLAAIRSAAQTAAPPDTQPATAPAPLTARVLEVVGDVQHAPLESADWQPCRVDDEYPPQTVIRTGVRSSIKLQLGQDDTYTALVIEPATRTILSELHRTADAKRIRIGVGYGRIRAGVVEGGLRSDFTVDSPVATLSKRGTWNFGLFYERGTDRFEVFLLDHGLVDAFNRLTGEQRTLLPGELVRQTMRRWLDQAQLLRNVPITDLLGLADLDIAFNRLRQDGLRVLDPEGGHRVLIDLSPGPAQAAFASLARQALGPVPAPPRGGLDPRTRPEGFFGTGRGDELVPILIEAGSPLADAARARPGRYLFRRSALEGWLQGQARR